MYKEAAHSLNVSPFTKIVVTATPIQLYNVIFNSNSHSIQSLVAHLSQVCPKNDQKDHGHLPLRNSCCNLEIVMILLGSGLVPWVLLVGFGRNVSIKRIHES